MTAKGPLSADDVLDGTPAALFVTDLTGVVLAHSAALGEWFSAPEGASLVGRNLVDWLPASSRLLYETQVMPRLLEAGELREVLFEVLDGDGIRRHVMLQARVRTETDGTRTVHIAGLDAGARSAFERELVEARRAADLAHRRLVLLQEATSALAVARGLDDLGETLVDAAGRAMASAWTLVRIVDPADPSGVGVRSWGSVPPGVQPPARLHADAEQFVARDLEAIAGLAEAEQLRRATVEAFMVTPIVRTVGAGAGSVIGEVRNWFRRPRTLDADELETLLSLAAQAERVADHLSLQERLRHRALHDGLTGLPNRQLFEERLDQLLETHAEDDEVCAVLFIDLDGFKDINDRLGHSVGDGVLREVALRLTAVARLSDTVARLGGDEFLVAVGGMPEEAVAALAERLRAAVAEPLTGDAEGAPLSASVGALSWRGGGSEDPPSAAELMAAADEAMYEAKRAGKDGVRVRAWGRGGPQASS
ncbi:diguanylate cyclase domain-containing protein [Microbacterium sp. NPDC055903]